MENETTRLSVCGVCGDSCFVDLKLRGGKIVCTEKAEGHPNVKGGLCLRGAALKQYLDAPERIRTPLLRTGEKGSGEFRPIGWDEAFALIAEKLRSAKETDGARSAVFYSGHPKWYRYVLAELARDYGSPNYCTESSTCHNARCIALKMLFGRDDVFLPDIGGCKTLLCWGTNPAYSKINMAGGILSVARRGGNLIVVDAKKTPMSEHATLHLQPRYGTDCALALGLANVIFSEGLENRDYLENYTYGAAEFRQYVSAFTPEETERITGVSAEKLITAARMIGADVPLSIFTSSCGIAHSPNSVQAYRAIFLLAALTGSYDVPGGVHGSVGRQVKLNGFHHAAKPRIDVENEFDAGRFPLWNKYVPNEEQAVGLTRAVLTGEPYPIRNLICFGMNYRMFPDAEQMRQALLKADFYVDVDLFMTDSAKCADLVLPCQADTERDYVYAVQNGHLLYLPAAVDAPGTKNDVEILLGICAALGLHGELTGMRSYEEYLEFMLSSTGVTLSELKQHPEGMAARTFREGALHGYARGLATPSGKIEFLCEALAPYADLPGCAVLPEFFDPALLNPDSAKYPLTLCVGTRRPQFFQSRTYRVPWLAGLEAHTVVNISPAEAARRGLKDGQRVKITTPMHTLEFPLEIDPGMQDGAVCLLHDDEQENQDANTLVSADYLDPISGFPGFRSYFCDISPVEVAK